MLDPDMHKLVAMIDGIPHSAFVAQDKERPLFLVLNSDRINELDVLATRLFLDEDKRPDYENIEAFVNAFGWQIAPIETYKEFWVQGIMYTNKGTFVFG